MRILALDTQQILREVDILEKDVKQMRYNLFKLAWHMRGSLSVDEAFELPPEDRDILGDIIKDNLETTKKTGLPYF